MTHTNTIYPCRALLLGAIIMAQCSTFSFTDKALAQTPTWQMKASLLMPRYGHGVAAATNGKIYAVGGIADIGAGNVAIVNSVEEFDPASNTWASRASMPTARATLGVAAASNGKIYAIGGNEWLATNEEYNPTTDTWQARQPMQSPRNYLGVVGAANGKVYAVGGSRNFAPLRDVEAYDPATDTWTTRASIPTARFGHGLVAAPNGKIYALGGVGTEGYGAVLGSVEAYDPASNSWSSKASMPTPRFIFAATLGPDGKIYTVGGSIGQYSGADVAIVEIYDPTTDTWQTGASLSTAPRRFIGGATVHGKVYIVGGAFFGGTGSPQATVESLEVQGQIITFNGFYDPVKNPGIVNSGKAGRTYPVKWQLRDDNNTYISSLAAITSVKYKRTSCSAFTDNPAGALEAISAGNTGLHYDAIANQYIFNWATPAMGCYTLFVTLSDGQVHYAYFDLFK